MAPCAGELEPAFAVLRRVLEAREDGFGRVEWHAEERLRTHLRKRHKLKDRGSAYRRFPSHALYTRHGLYKIPTTAGWTQAHAVR